MKITDFLARMTAAKLEMHAYHQRALEHIGKKVTKDAQHYLGTYQPGVGPYPAWAPLAQSTLEDKAKHGHPSPSPLLRTGEMQRSIKYSVGPESVRIGSDSKEAQYQELGTNGRRPIPPRSFLGRGLYTNIDYAKHELGILTVDCLFGRK